MPALQRWPWFRLVPRPRWTRWFLCACLVLCALASLAFWTTVARASASFLLMQCSDGDSKAFLESLVGVACAWQGCVVMLLSSLQCRDYMQDQVTGSLCEPLCLKEEIEFLRCLGHGVKVHVLQAKWGTSTVVLKAKSLIGDKIATLHVTGDERYKRKLTKEEFIRDANLTLFMNLAGKKNVPETLSVLEHIFSECDVLDDGLLTYSEALVCWQLVETEEYVLYSLLRGRSAIPDLYGVCGNMYAVQYATADPYLGNAPASSDGRSWEFRVRLALALVDMVRSIENTPYGTLFLCDVQEPNFGVVRSPDTGQLVAKAIDVDISWFESGLVSAARFERNKTCKSNEDCAFISCEVACSLDTHTCSGEIGSNNLQVLCRRLFLPRARWAPALLRDPPASIAPRLQSLLDQCAHPSHPQPHLDTQLLEQLVSLLQSSISVTSSQA